MGIIRALGQFFRRLGVGLLAGLMVMSDVATGVDVRLTAKLVDGGYSAARATFLLNTLALAITIPATYVTARVLQRFPVRWVMCLLLVMKGGGVRSARNRPAFRLRLPRRPFDRVCRPDLGHRRRLLANLYALRGSREDSVRYGRHDVLRTLFLMAGGVGAGQVVVELGCAGVFWLAAIMAFVAASLRSAVHSVGAGGLLGVPQHGGPVRSDLASDCATSSAYVEAAGAA